MTTVRKAIGFIAAAFLAACSGYAGTQTPTTNVNPATLVTAPGIRPNFARQGIAGPLIRPHCCARQKTLFVSDAFGGSSFTGTVYMFDYVSGKSLGQVAQPPEGFLEVQGGCSDNGGNVYFANTSLSTIDEYAHDGSYVATIQDSGQYPVGCAYDRTTDDLAVSNIRASGGGSGSISIFHDGVLQHTYYLPSGSVYFLAYQDDTGILWLDGSNSSGQFQLYKFFNGIFTPVRITGGSIGFPGGVAWSAKTHAINVGDQATFSSPTIYQISTTGRILGSTVLACDQPSDICDVVEFAIKGPGIVATDAVGLDVALYPYPAGGQPIRQYGPAQGYVQPIGVAISPNVP